MKTALYFQLDSKIPSPSQQRIIRAYFDKNCPINVDVLFYGHNKGKGCMIKIITVSNPRSVSLYDRKGDPSPWVGIGTILRHIQKNEPVFFSIEKP